MPDQDQIKIDEFYSSPNLEIDVQGNGASKDLVFKIVGTDDENEALLKLLTSPDSGGGSNDRPDGVAYANSFDTSGGTISLQHSLETKQIVGAGGAAPLNTFGNLIGVTPDGVEGVEIAAPGFSWTETLEIPIEQYTTTYIRALALATATTNSAPFRGFAAGEVLLQFATGATDNSLTNATINFTFAVQVNATNLSVGPLSGINKRGWEYIWFVTEEISRDIGGEMIKTREPKFACVERVYEESNHSSLGLPT